MNITSIWNSVYPVLVAILFFELIIVIHEWGHFTAARLMKIKVNEFSVGMGPKLLQHKGKKTTYTLRLILFGGYCSMEGEDKESDDENAFVNKKVWQRIYVVIAGALMNLVLGFVIVLILVCLQNLVGTTEVAKFDDNAVSQSYGLQVGDKIKSIDGMRVYTTNDVTTGFSRCSNENVNLVVESLRLNLIQRIMRAILIQLWIFGSGVLKKLLQMLFPKQVRNLFLMPEWYFYPFTICLSVATAYQI